MPDMAKCATLHALAPITLLQGSFIHMMWEGKLRGSEITWTLQGHTVAKLR